MKLSKTVQRKVIVDELRKLKCHPTADELYEVVRRKLPRISLGTVYRNLKLLEELGKVRRVTAHQGTERYDAICGDHAHFLCQRCGCLRDLTGVDSEALRSAIRLEAGATLTKLDITVTGICPGCAE